MDATKIAELKSFVQQCQDNPAILSLPSLKFFRDYLESLGATLPAAGFAETKSAKPDKTSFEEEEPTKPAAAPVEEEQVEEEEEPEIVESDVELDTEGVVEPDDEPPQKMGDPNVEVTEEMRDAAQMAKAKAMEAVGEGNLEPAIDHLTEAILSNPSSSILYANRAGVYVKMKKPNAAIRDCDEALKLNPDSARAYRSRGEAYTLLGKWKEAARDLRLASRLDYDEETAAFLKRVEPNAHRLEEHSRKYERLRGEREERIARREREQRRRKAQAAYDAEKKAEEEAKARRGRSTGHGGCADEGCGGCGAGEGGGFGGGFPAGMGFGGGMPAGMGGGGMGGRGMGGGGAAGGPNMGDFLQDPEIMAALGDPAVLAAMQDVMANPANMLKYQGDPKVGPLLAKLMSKFGGAAAS